MLVAWEDFSGVRGLPPILMKSNPVHFISPLPSSRPILGCTKGILDLACLHPMEHSVTDILIAFHFGIEYGPVPKLETSMGHQCHLDVM